MEFEEYKAEKIRKAKAAGKSEPKGSTILSWWNMSAHYETNRGGPEIDEADHGSVTTFMRSDDGKLMRQYRMGQMGVMDDALQADDMDSYNRIRKRTVRPLKRDAIWDGGITIKAGEIPPPRFASEFNANQRTHGVTHVTRRGCARGVLGLSCTHPRGSSECNGGVNVVRRMGDNY